MLVLFTDATPAFLGDGDKIMGLLDKTHWMEYNPLNGSRHCTKSYHSPKVPLQSKLCTRIRAFPGVHFGGVIKDLQGRASQSFSALLDVTSRQETQVHAKTSIPITRIATATTSLTHMSVANGSTPTLPPISSGGWKAGVQDSFWCMAGSGPTTLAQ